MAFRLPSVIVYQELVSTSVTPVAPFMDLCIVGPLYQVVSDGACTNFTQLNSDDIYSVEYPELTLGAIVDTDSVSVKASDVFVKVWPTTNYTKDITGRITFENYERKTNNDNSFVEVADDQKVVKTTSEGYLIAEFKRGEDDAIDWVFDESKTYEGIYQYDYYDTGEVLFEYTNSKDEECLEDDGSNIVYDRYGNIVDLSSDNFTEDGEFETVKLYKLSLSESIDGKVTYKQLGDEVKITDDMFVYKGYAKGGASAVLDESTDEEGTETLVDPQAIVLTSKDFSKNTLLNTTKIYDRDGKELTITINSLYIDSIDNPLYYGDLTLANADIKYSMLGELDKNGRIIADPVFDVYGVLVNDPAKYSVKRLYSRINADTSYVYCSKDMTETFSEAGVSVGDYLEVTYKFLPDESVLLDSAYLSEYGIKHKIKLETLARNYLKAIEDTGEESEQYAMYYRDDAFVYDTYTSKIMSADKDASGNFCLTLSKYIPDGSEKSSFVKQTAVVKRAVSEDIELDNDYVTIEDDLVSISWITKRMYDEDGKISSVSNEPPLITSTASDDPLPLYSANISISYRALRQDMVNDFTTISSYSEAQAKLGNINIKNPLSVAASIVNASIGEMSYKVLPIESDDYNGYIKALDILANNEKVYCIIPMTDNKEVISAYATHCKNMSAPLKSKWRIMYGSMPMPVTKVMLEYNEGRLTYFDEESVLIKDIANGAFISSNCRISDYVDIYDSKNTYKYSLQLIRVINETTAKFSRVLWKRTSEGYETQIDEYGNNIYMSLANVDCKAKNSCKVNPVYKVRDINYEIVRRLDTQGVSEAIAGIAESFKNKRLRYVMPDTIMLTVNGVLEAVAGYYLCVALGAMRCGLPPHQGFSTMGISGITRVLNSNKLFTEEQLTEMAAAGVFWVAQDEPEELPYVLYQTTTDNTQLETAEDSIVTTIDYASKYYKNNLKNVLGRYNVNSISLNYVKTVINSCSDDMTTTSYEYIGPVLTSASLTNLYAEADHIYPTIRIEVPYPVNGVDITLQV